MTFRTRRVVETVALVVVLVLLLLLAHSGLRPLGVLVLVLLLAGALFWVWRPGRPAPRTQQPQDPPVQDGAPRA